MIGGLGNRAIVVDADLSHECPPHVDVVIYDLGAAPGLTGYAELRRLVALDVPLVALVYDDVAGTAGPEDGAGPGCGAQFISLDVTAASCWQVLERVAPARCRRPPDAHGQRPPAGLTNRELTVIALIGAGLSNKQIAERLFVSGNTVKTYVRTGYRKIGVQSRIQAAMWAMEQGWWPDRSPRTRRTRCFLPRPPEPAGPRVAASGRSRVTHGHAALRDPDMRARVIPSPAASSFRRDRVPVGRECTGLGPATRAACCAFARLWACRRTSAQGQSRRARRRRTDVIVCWAGATRDSSSHVIGVDTGAPGRARTAYAGTAVWP